MLDHLVWNEINKLKNDEENRNFLAYYNLP